MTSPHLGHHCKTDNSAALDRTMMPRQRMSADWYTRKAAVTGARCVNSVIAIDNPPTKFALYRNATILINHASLSSPTSLLITLVVALGIRNTNWRRAKSNTVIEHRNSMVAIVTKDQAIPKATANAACRSLDEEINRKRNEGALKAGTSTVPLEWTVETRDAVRVFESAFKANSADLAPIQSLSGKPIQGQLNIACPIVYSDVSTVPKWSPSSALGFGIIGIIALGTLRLPEIGDSGPTTIESGSVAYYRDSSRVVFRACEGRGILFYIS